jgi:hypothetical protein
MWHSRSSTNIQWSINFAASFSAIYDILGHEIRNLHCQSDLVLCLYTPARLCARCKYGPLSKTHNSCQMVLDQIQNNCEQTNLAHNSFPEHISHINSTNTSSICVLSYSANGPASSCWPQRFNGRGEAAWLEGNLNAWWDSPSVSALDNLGQTLLQYASRNHLISSNTYQIISNTLYFIHLYPWHEPSILIRNYSSIQNNLEQAQIHSVAHSYFWRLLAFPQTNAVGDPRGSNARFHKQLCREGKVRSVHLNIQFSFRLLILSIKNEDSAFNMTDILWQTSIQTWNIILK